MGTGIFGTGISALNAAQAGLLTTSHNIANAATPGFHRQEVVQRASQPQYTGAGFIGKGVDVTTVKRMYNEFLAKQVVQAQTQSSQLDSYYAHIKQLDDMLADPTAGLAPALQDFFDATADVAANPSSVPSRQSMLSASQSLVSRFHALDERYTQIREGVNKEIVASVGNINSFAEQIASLNRQIVVAQSGGNRQPPNDLLDQRDQLVLQLNREIGASVVRQDDGSYNVFIGNGQALVVGVNSFTLTTGPHPDDPARTGIAYMSGGNKVWMSDTSLQGGALGGFLAFRSGMLDGAQNALGRIAIGLASTFNAQHALGQDLAGALGGAYFKVPVLGNASATVDVANVAQLTTSDYRLTRTGTDYTLTRLSDGTASTAGPLPVLFDGLRVTASTLADGESVLLQPARDAARQIEVMIRDTGKIAAAAPIATAAGASNTGTGRISAGSITGALPSANPQPAVTITFHVPYDGEYDITGTGAGLPAANQAYTAGQNITFNGWTVQISGAPEAGDTFTIRPNANGTADNRNALALAQLGTASTLVGGTASYQSAYAQLVSDVGNKTRELEVTSEAQASLLAQTVESEEAMAGVNLDEEAANLLRYQQAYQAAAKVLQIASTLFDSVLDIGR